MPFDRLPLRERHGRPRNEFFFGLKRREVRLKDMASLDIILIGREDDGIAAR